MGESNQLGLWVLGGHVQEPPSLTSDAGAGHGSAPMSVPPLQAGSHWAMNRGPGKCAYLARKRAAQTLAGGRKRSKSLCGKVQSSGCRQGSAEGAERDVVQEKESGFLQPSPAHGPHRWRLGFRVQRHSLPSVSIVGTVACDGPVSFRHWGRLQMHSTCGERQPEPTPSSRTAWLEHDSHMHRAGGLDRCPVRCMGTVAAAPAAGVGAGLERGWE